MQQIDVSARTIGINFKEGKAIITVWAPLAEKVEVEIQVKNEDETVAIALKRKVYGYWQASTNRVNEGTLYKIKVDDKQPFPDPASLLQPDGVHGPSQAIDITNYPWTETTWNNPPLEDYIIYELHTGTFTTEGTFAALEEKLGYLKELGVNAIELMPVAQFPGSRNWGYDGVFPFAVQNSYGGPRGLQHLVDACHRNGLAVILDVVYNHLGPEGNYLGEFGPYFTSKYHTPWGNAVNFDDAWCDGVRRFVVENALMWFRDFRIDALRLDAVHAIKDFSAVHILKEIKLRLDELVQKTGRQHYLIVEMDLNDTRYIDRAEKGGYGMDAQWVDEFHHALRVTAGQERAGYYADYTGLEDLAKAYRDAYVYTGQWSAHRNRFFGVEPTENPGRQFIVFSQNHDQVGNRMLGERIGQLVSFETQKLLAGAVLTSPYIPMLFMGEEWHEPHPFLYFVSHTDPVLAEAVRNGRKKEFAAFHLEGEAPDPMAEETFTNSRLQWELIQQGKHRIMLDYYKKLIALRKEEPALKTLDRKALTATANGDNQTLVLHRWQGINKIVCLLNFSEEKSIFNMDKAGEWTVLLNSADQQWGGPGALQISEGSLKLQPQSICILKQ